MLVGSTWHAVEARLCGPSAAVPCSLRFAGAFTLRQRMLNFVQNIQYYMMFEVMEPTWHVLEKNLKSVSLSSWTRCWKGSPSPGLHSSTLGATCWGCLSMSCWREGAECRQQLPPTQGREGDRWGHGIGVSLEATGPELSLARFLRVRLGAACGSAEPQPFTGLQY